MFWAAITAMALTTFWYVVRRYRTPSYHTHKFSRNTMYMNKSLISPLKVSWLVKFEDYRPLGSPCEQKNLSWWFQTTRVDGRTRFLVEVSPHSFSFVPINPIGRTGVIGKGLFPKLGPNNICITVVWSRKQGLLNMAYVKEGKHVYTGYLDHPLNTDHAWVEADVYLRFSESEVKEECADWLVSFIDENTHRLNAIKDMI